MVTLPEIKDSVSGLIQQAYDQGKADGLASATDKIYSELELQAKLTSAIAGKDAEMADFKAKVAQEVTELKEADVKEDAAVSDLDALSKVASAPTDGN